MTKVKRYLSAPVPQDRSARIISWVGSLILCACALGNPVALSAQTNRPAALTRGECKMEPDWNVATGNPERMPTQLMGVGITQRINYRIPLSLTFRNSAGKSVRLRDYFGKKAVILSLVYFSCPMLCPLEEQALLAALKQMRFTAGKQFDVVTVSFDPHDTPEIAAQKRRLYLREYARRAAAHGWYFLTGTEASVARLTRAVGFHYRYDPQTHMFAHAVALVVLTPTGKVAEYFYGIQYPPGKLRLALVAASHGKVGSPIDQVILYCYRYNPVSGKFDFVISHVLIIGGAATILMLGGLLLVMIRGGHRHTAAI